MHIIFITLALGVLISWLLMRMQASPPDAPFKTAVKNELKALLIVLGGMLALFLIVLLFTLFFGPIPPVHEW